MKFTTKDRDNDKSGINCAFEAGASKPLNGWWYNHCSHIDPNAYYGFPTAIYLGGNKEHPLPFTEIKIRPYRCVV